MPSDCASSLSGDAAGSGAGSCSGEPAGGLDLVLVVPEDDHLPAELRVPRPPLLLVPIQLPDVVEHPLEVALAPVDLVRLAGGAVDRARDAAELAPDHRLEDGISHVIQVGAVPRRQRNVPPVRVFDDAFDVGIQEDLAPIRQLDFRYPRVVVHDPAELVELEEAGSDLRFDQPLGGRTARTCELADGGRLEPDPVLVTAPHRADAVYCAPASATRAPA